MSHWYFKLIDDENDFDVICDDILYFQIVNIGCQKVFHYDWILHILNRTKYDALCLKSINVRCRCKNVKVQQLNFSKVATLLESTIGSTVFK